MPDTDDEKSTRFFSQPTRRMRGTTPLDGTRSPTRPLPESASHETVPIPRDDSPEPDLRTRRARPDRGESLDPRAASAPSADVEPEFVVGWVVVIDGPGRGKSRPLGYGMNAIGRGDGMSVRLDFGDSEISRANHCQIAYDHRNRRFYLQHGGGQNLTYLGGDPVFAATPLLPGSDITLGRTTLRFVALCDSEFTWEDAETPESRA